MEELGERMEQIYLSRRNILTLLSKLDRKKAGVPTTCTLTKYDNQHPIYPQTMQACAVTALEDAEYYVDREPGKMHPLDEPK
jgi:hypothetical protein